MIKQNQDIIAALANPVRIDIVNNVSETKLKPIQIAKKLGISIQALKRPLDKLLKSKIVEKDLEGFIKLSPIGDVSLKQLSSFEFLTKYKEHFTTHSFDGIPDHLLMRIGELNTAEFISSMMQAGQRVGEEAAKAKEYYYGISTAIPLEVFDIMMPKLENRIKFRAVYAKNTAVPKGFNHKLTTVGWHKKGADYNVKEKFIRKLHFNMGISENAAHISFANKDTGESDFDGMFVSDDEKFCKWCEDLFDYYWNKVPKINQFKLKEK